MCINRPLTDLQGMSTGETPNSETRAMVRAHEELCDMLGISINDTRIRRTRSVIGRPPDFDPTNVMSIYSDVSGRLGSGRPASLPPPSDMAEIQAADVRDQPQIISGP